MRKSEIKTGQLVAHRYSAYDPDGPVPAITVGPIPVEEDAPLFSSFRRVKKGKGGKYLVLTATSRRGKAIDADPDAFVERFRDLVTKMHDRLDAGEVLDKTDLAAIRYDDETHLNWKVVSSSRLLGDYVEKRDEFLKQKAVTARLEQQANENRRHNKFREMRVIEELGERDLNGGVELDWNTASSETPRVTVSLATLEKLLGIN